MLENQRNKETQENRGKIIRIRDAHERCEHPEHNPPMHEVLKTGEYRHTCPGCKEKSKFVVPKCN